MKILIVVIFIAILASLGSALFSFFKDHGDSDRTVKALTLRIGLSVGLFALIMVLAATGVIQPHGIQ
ncbi:MAG: twin transmembrane helix small protein [Gammaproteobacteria bacterium]|nr:twin transmembrane helix small protein [Gammaproteobacteria bacterium]